MNRIGGNRMNNLFISVIINNYNYAQYLGQAIESVLNQTYNNFELIIVDDGSSDNSREVAESFSDCRIRCMFKENGGQASAFNAGYEASRGDIICFLDSDDWWKQEKLEQVIKWDVFLDGNYAFTQHGVDIWEEGETHPYKSAMISGDCLAYTFESRKLGLFVGTSGLTFRKNIIDKVFPVPEAFVISADAYLTRTSFIFGPVYSIPESLGFYRKHENAVLGNLNHKQDNFQREILFPELNTFYRKNKIPYRYSLELFNTGNKGRYVNDWMLQRFLMKNRIEEICQQYPRIALYGAGSHTRWLQQLLGDMLKKHVVAILDDKSCGESFFDGIVIEDLSSWDNSVADAIVLSTDCFQQVMKNKCRQRFREQVPIIDIYEGLPIGPYPKYIK